MKNAQSALRKFVNFHLLFQRDNDCVPQFGSLTGSMKRIRFSTLLIVVLAAAIALQPVLIRDVDHQDQSGGSLGTNAGILVTELESIEFEEQQEPVEYGEGQLQNHTDPAKSVASEGVLSTLGIVIRTRRGRCGNQTPRAP